MKQHIPLLMLGACAIVTAAPAAASVFLIDMQGASPNRVAVYVEDATLDRTPVADVLNPGPYSIREIDVSMIYEAAAQPHWAEYQIQFKCPRASYGRGASRRYGEGGPLIRSNAETVEFRMAGGDKVMKQKIDILPLQPTDWQTSSNYTMRQAWRVACDGDAINRAKIAVAKDRVVDGNALRAKLATIGITGIELIPNDPQMSALADFTWANFWKDVPKPYINMGRKLTPAEQQAFRAQVAQMREQVNNAQAMVAGRAAAMKAGFDFTEAAARYRGKRHVSRTEANLLRVWLSKTEQDVVAANGAPVVRQAGIARTLSYGQTFDNQVMWQNVASGATFTSGGYKSCNVRYVLIPDNGGVFRVADVNVFGGTGGDARGMSNPCTDILNVPNP